MAIFENIGDGYYTNKTKFSRPYKNYVEELRSQIGIEIAFGGRIVRQLERDFSAQVANEVITFSHESDYVRFMLTYG